MAPDDEDDPKVKQLLDPATVDDLARWFTLPSFQQVAEQPKPEATVDEEMQEVIARRDKALAAVDPEFIESLRMRNEERPQSVLKFKATIEVRVDDQFGTLDHTMIERAASIAEPRDVEISEELRDDMKDCTPQALLRDLHRAEFDFDKTFELVDVTANLRMDIVAEVAQAMATSWKLPELGVSPVIESTALVEAVRADRRRPWTDYLPALRNRTVRE